jgi:hypothetical protein
MRDYNAIDIFSNPMSVEDMQDALLGPQTDISQYIQPDDRDLLDKTVEGYEENVPLPAQIAAGFTLPGMAMDIAAAGKYSRDSFGNFKEGEILPGLGNLGIAALSGLAAVPLVGELANLAKQPLKKGVASLANNNPRYQITRHQEDLYTGNPLGDAHSMYDRAVRLAPEFNQQIDDIAKSLNLETTLPEMTTKIDAATLQKLGTVKKIPRIVEKSRLKYDKDVTQLTDPLRTRIVVNTPAEEEAVVNLIKNQYKLFDKGRDIKPEGFVDRKLNIQFTGSNGENLVAEVGVITAPMWRASDKNHVLYEEFRSLFPKGMPTDPKELASISRNVRLKGEALNKEMQTIFKEAKDQIDPDFYVQEVKKFASGGYVTAGSSGRSAPMTPNVFSNDPFDIFEPSTKKSATWLGSASVQSDLPGDIKYPRSPSPTGANTAGPSSHAKYNVSNFSINSSLQKFTKNYNPNDVDIFEVE